MELERNWKLKGRNCKRTEKKLERNWEKYCKGRNWEILMKKTEKIQKRNCKRTRKVLERN